LHSSLAIEGNSLSLDEVTSIVDGKTVQGPQNEIREVKNAFSAYKMLDSLDPFDENDLLKAHGIMMDGLMEGPGSFRSGDEAIIDGDGNIVHVASHPEQVGRLVDDLLEWTRQSDYPMIIKSCVFHYEFEYIHPFEDGNGRVGRLWRTLLLSKYDESFKWVPVESMIRSYQKEYYDSIAISNESLDCTAFLEFMTGAILRSLEEAVEASARGDIPTEGRLSSNEVALYVMIRDGHFRNIAQAAETLGVSVPTLNRCLKILRDEGLIRKEGNRKSGEWVTVREHEHRDCVCRSNLRDPR
jgi:Fic family protein